MSGQFEFGKPGGSLRDKNQSFASKDRSKVGAAGEVKTAEIIRAYQSTLPESRRFTVVHDIMLPSDKYTVNIDHLIITGSRLVVLDSKVWQPARYVSAFGHVYRMGNGSFFGRFEPAEKQTVQLICNVLAKRFGIPVNGALVVWSSKYNSEPKLGLYRPKGIKVLTGADLHRQLPRYVRSQAGDEGLIQAVLKLR